MKKTKGTMLFTMIIILVTISFSCFFYNKSYAKKNINLFDEIINETNSKVKEKGVEFVFTLKNKNDLKKISSYLNLNYKKVLNKLDNNNSIKLDENNIIGYIDKFYENNNTIISIKLSSKREGLHIIDKIKNDIQLNLKEKKYNFKIFEYVKSKSSDTNIDNINKNLLKTLKKYRCSNINTIRLERGYSTIAYTNTKKYDQIISNDKFVDLNCAVCKYDSGNYVIIGTPQINTTY
ncbi:hypothetical protein [Clostridium oceanicum]|uniref:YwmB family TATA-box binding protein n=1 Tax=Clostridium oceanicum TaxID=1543 RepID=A0ABP3UX92_9CLOT